MTLNQLAAGPGSCPSKAPALAQNDRHHQHASGSRLERHRNRASELGFHWIGALGQVIDSGHLEFGCVCFSLSSEGPVWKITDVNTTHPCGLRTIQQCLFALSLSPINPEFRVHSVASKPSIQLPLWLCGDTTADISAMSLLWQELHQDVDGSNNALLYLPRCSPIVPRQKQQKK